MAKGSWFKAQGRWWEPYVGVLLIAAVCGCVVIAFIAANSAEIIRTLRWGGS